MYAACTDENAGALVGIYRGTSTEDDYARCVDGIVAMDAKLAGSGKPYVCILVTELRTSTPPPAWRRRMAEANKSLRVQRYYFALVCPSPLLRGVLTAILWITGSRDGHQYAAFATFAEAVTWVEQENDRKYPELHQLLERATGALPRES